MKYYVQSNPNVSWLGSPGSWGIYFGICAMSRFVLAAFYPALSYETAWDIFHIAHCVTTFILLHWIKGSPFGDIDQGRYDAATWWEQIDDGRQNTPSRKIFIFVTVILYLMTVHYTDYRKGSFVVHTLLLVVCSIPKLTVMHGTRLFGVNK